MECLLAFFTMMFLAICAFEKTNIWRVVVPSLCAMHFGVLIEGMQFFIPTRTCNPADIAANFWRILLGTLVWWGTKRGAKKWGDENAIF